MGAGAGGAGAPWWDFLSARRSRIGVSGEVCVAERSKKVQFPFRVAGISIYKPARRSRSVDRWMAAWVHPKTGKRYTEHVSQDLRVTERWARQKSEWIENVRLGLVDHRDLRIAEAYTKPL